MCVRACVQACSGVWKLKSDLRTGNNAIICCCRFQDDLVAFLAISFLTSCGGIICQVPRTVSLLVEYYQRRSLSMNSWFQLLRMMNFACSPTNKRITSASITFMDYSDKDLNGSVDVHYSLTVEYKVLSSFQLNTLLCIFWNTWILLQALDYLSLLNRFSFDPPGLPEFLENLLSIIVHDFSCNLQCIWDSLSS